MAIFYDYIKGHIPDTTQDYIQVQFTDTYPVLKKHSFTSGTGQTMIDTETPLGEIITTDGPNQTFAVKTFTFEQEKDSPSYVSIDAGSLLLHGESMLEWINNNAIYKTFIDIKDNIWKVTYNDSPIISVQQDQLVTMHIKLEVQNELTATTFKEDGTLLSDKYIHQDQIYNTATKKSSYPLTKMIPSVEYYNQQIKELEAELAKANFKKGFCKVHLEETYGKVAESQVYYYPAGSKNTKYIRVYFYVHLTKGDKGSYLPRNAISLRFFYDENYTQPMKIISVNSQYDTDSWPSSVAYVGYDDDMSTLQTGRVYELWKVPSEPGMMSNDNKLLLSPRGYNTSDVYDLEVYGHLAVESPTEV